MQHTQIDCNKKKIEVVNCKIRETKKVNIKSRFHHYSAKEVYNGVNKAVLMMTKSNLNDSIMRKKRK